MDNFGIIKISYQLMEEVLKEHLHFPEDFKLSAIRTDSFEDFKQHTVKVKGTSREFEKVAEGNVISEYTVKWGPDYPAKVVKL